MPFAQPDNRAGVGDPAGPDEWFKSLPIVTQYWFGATMLVTLTVNFQIISPYKIVFDWVSLKGNLELWRLLTPFCYAGPFDFGTLIGCYMLVQFSKQYERGGPFNTGAGGGTADYIFCMMFGTIGMLCSYPFLAPILQLPPVFCRNLTYYVLYIWSKRNPTANANIWGFPVKAIYLPFAYLAMTVFMGQGYMDMLHGIAIGHIYYFLVDVVPVVYGKDILQTPAFLIQQFGIGEYTPANTAGGGRPVGGGGGFGGRPAPAAAAAPRPGGHNWGGGGQRLGTN